MYLIPISLALSVLLLTAGAASISAQDRAVGEYVVDSIPEGYHLYAYDDCGVEGRQPHVDMADSYIWTFNTSDTDADLKSRSAVFSYKQVNMTYNDLDPKLSYVLAMTYASDHVYNRVQSLWADGVQLHGPYALPKARAVRVMVKVPESITRDGKMKLELKIHGEVNATASIVELWASAPPPVSLQIGTVTGCSGSLQGRVADLSYEGLEGVDVQLSSKGDITPLATVKTRQDGTFTIPKEALKRIESKGDLLIMATKGEQVASKTVPASDLFFEPVRYRPIASKVAGLDSHMMLLDGKWRINPNPEDDVLKTPLSASAWSDINVPGQWLQQGFDIPIDKAAAMAKEFTVPKEWAGHRIFLRFDSIHAGTHYRINGRELGYGENLYTPVEWEITDAVRPGEKSRLDLQMKVQTTSEVLSCSSSYAFHSLGGVDRSVRIYALPKVYVKDMHLATDLDKDYRDADLQIKLTVDNPNREDVKGLAFRVLLAGPDGKHVNHSNAEVKLDGLPQGTRTVDITSHVANPLKWNAEQPHLYKLALELTQDGKLVERIERNIGFRKIEIKESQFCVNGKRVKMAGICRHEIDPLTGRANTMHLAESDIKLLKAANLNYLRTSHYPPPMELLDAADRLGMYVEVEAPFCWVAPADELINVKEVLTPTSAMIDYCHTHPSVVVWSIANESHFSPVFAESNELVKSLDPTRPTTFNHPFSGEEESKVCDISNWHYPGIPYEDVKKEDSRPLIFGEYFFPVCHEQTDVHINPGLRELWGHSQADPSTDYAKSCLESFHMPSLHPGLYPGGWNDIVNSDRLIGGAIWAAFDEPFYFKNREHCGYAWVHGFWGIIDAWRRPKPEYWLSKMIFSPVWFPKQQADFTPGQTSIHLPVENRYSFTNLSELGFNWELGKDKGSIKASLPPAGKGEVEVPIPKGAKEGDRLTIRVNDSKGDLVTVRTILLGKEKPASLPQVQAGAPKVQDDGKNIVVEGSGFCLVIDKTTGDINTADPRDKSPLLQLPSVHLTRFDFGDLNPRGPQAPNYGVFPETKTRTVDEVTVKEQPQAVEIIVKDHYENFSGSLRWLIDKNGVGKISYDYTYTGEEMDTRETGIRILLKPEYDTAKWRRWSEWGFFPEDSISRTEGTAKARRDKKIVNDSEGVKPNWTWALDQTEMGTNDFRSAKFHIYEGSLTADNGSGVRVYANADAHLRPCLDQKGVWMHILSRCRIGQYLLKNGDRIKGEFTVELAPE